MKRNVTLINMIDKPVEIHDGFAIYCKDNKPLGVISSNGDRHVINNPLSKNIKRYLIGIEDQRFYEHGAIDFKAISRALYQNLKSGKILQGGSTITQQLARNILRDNRKHIIRKIKETAFAFKLENQYSKDEIIDLYFDNVFWGKKNYGVRTASLEYFSKEPEGLTTVEQIALITLLRGPNYYLKNKIEFDKRCAVLGKILVDRQILSSKKCAQIKKSNIQLQNRPLQIFRSATIPFISKDIIHSKHSIITSLNRNLQSEVASFISACKYPMSVIAIKNNKVICFGSSNGTDYPFYFRSNVGSTLKPFIYPFLREKGISENELISTIALNDKWNIREAQPIDKSQISLSNALLLSNNNVFVNAANKVGLDQTLLHLSTVLEKSGNNFLPSSILGASLNGLSLYELVLAYDKFFANCQSNQYKMECLSILNEIARSKFGDEFPNSVLKTGTTNLNSERFAIVGHANTFFGFLRQGNSVDDYTKEGNFISSVLGFLKSISQRAYEWE